MSFSTQATAVIMALILLVLVPCPVGADFGDQPFRTWTDRTGQHKTEAVLVEVRDAAVTLKKKDGTRISLLVEHLSDADQQYVSAMEPQTAGEDAGDTDAREVDHKSATTQTPAWYVFTNKRTGDHFSGKLLGQRESGGVWFFFVESDSGQRGWLSASQWKRTIDTARQTADEQAERPGGRTDQPVPSLPTGGNVVEIDPSDGKELSPPASAHAEDVIVTGVGTDPERAIQNAFSQAIEQVVGLLVDAENVVKNDQLIHDEVLTFSRGYMEKYEVVRRWQEGDLHHAKIRAVVARGKLVDKLRGIKIAVRTVPGEVAARQIEFDVKNEEHAAQMFEKALTAFSMTKLTRVDIIGEPEITREGANAKVGVQIRVAPDMDQWKTFAPPLRTILDKTATRRASFIVPHSSSEEEVARRQLEGEGALVALLVNTVGDRTRWDVFRVPAPMGAAIEATIAKTRCRLVCVLLDEQGAEVARTVDRVSVGSYDAIPVGNYKRDLRAWFIGPTWSENIWHRTVLDVHRVIDISAEDLRRVVKTAAFLEEDMTGNVSSNWYRR